MNIKFKISNRIKFRQKIAGIFEVLTCGEKTLCGVHKCGELKGDK